MVTPHLGRWQVVTPVVRVSGVRTVDNKSFLAFGQRSTTSRGEFARDTQGYIRPAGAPMSRTSAGDGGLLKATGEPVGVVCLPPLSLTVTFRRR